MRGYSLDAYFSSTLRNIMKKLIHETTSIRDLCDRVASGLINIRPYWQRELVWTNTAKSLLIDSVLCGYLVFPLVFVPDEDEPDIYLTVDGQQRLSTIYDFREGGFALTGLTPYSYKGKEEDLNGKKYQDLPEILQQKFDFSQQSFSVLAGFGKQDIERMYYRLQRGVSLTPAEKRNAMITKEIPKEVRKLAKHPFISACGLRNSRGQYLNFAARSLLHEHRQTKKMQHINFTSMTNQALDMFFKNDPNMTEVIPTVESIYEKLKAFHWQAYPLISEIEAITVYIAASHLLQNYTLTNTQIAQAYQNFREKQNKIDIAKLPLLVQNNQNYKSSRSHLIKKFFRHEPEKDIGLDALEHDAWTYYYTKGLSGTTLLDRVEILVKWILNFNPDALLLDSQRDFSHYQKKVIFYNSGGQCALCKQRIHLNDTWHADHIKPYGQGGKTQISNGQALCPSCNLKKANK